MLEIKQNSSVNLMQNHNAGVRVVTLPTDGYFLMPSKNYQERSGKISTNLSQGKCGFFFFAFQLNTDFHNMNVYYLLYSQ